MKTIRQYRVMMAGALREAWDLLTDKKRPCTHPNIIELRWLSKNGTPMIDYRCPDCGDRYYGEVYVPDPENWGR